MKAKTILSGGMRLSELLIGSIAIFRGEQNRGSILEA